MLNRAEDMPAGLAQPAICAATVRVCEGNLNAATQWSLRASGAITVGTTPLHWIQENRNYSVESIAALKALVDAPIGSMASVAGYATAGNNGGGDFSFLGVPSTSRIADASAVFVVITGSSLSDDGVIFTFTRRGV